MAENTASENDVEKVYIAIDDKIKGYQVVESIGEGAYGQVFKVLKNAKKYAMKVEPNRLDGGPASITKEIEVMMELNNRGAKFFPIFETGGREPKFHMVVMTLLGENLQVLRMKGCNPKACTPGTWSRIGIQCLFVVKQMHDCGFLHHDLKPANFVWGQSDEVLTSRVFYLIDFGISSKFIRHIKGTPINQQNGFEFRTEKKKVHSLVGTPKYTSPKAHAMADLGRGDDLWSLMYMIAELVKPLPWEILEAKMLENTKLKSKLKDHFGMDGFGKIETMLHACTFNSFPNYEMIYLAFKEVFNKSGVSWLDPYDWEGKNMPSYKRWRQHAEKQRPLFAWEQPDVGSYFRKDPFTTVQNANVTGKTTKKKKHGKETTDETTVETCEEINGSVKKPQKGTELKKAVFHK